MHLNSRSYLDPRWTKQSGTPVAAGFMTARIEVRRPNPNVPRTYDAATRTWSGGGFNVVYTGMARVQPYGISGNTLVAQDETSRRQVRVQIESTENDITIDDIVVVLECPDNPNLTEYLITVRQSLMESNPWLTNLVCDTDMKRRHAN